MRSRNEVLKYLYTSHGKSQILKAENTHLIHKSYWLIIIYKFFTGIKVNSD